VRHAVATLCPLWAVWQRHLRPVKTINIHHKLPASTRHRPQWRLERWSTASSLTGDSWTTPVDASAAVPPLTASAVCTQSVMTCRDREASFSGARVEDAEPARQRGGLDPVGHADFAKEYRDHALGRAVGDEHPMCDVGRL